MYYKLKDTGSSYYDASQAKGIVSNRIEELKETPHVFAALREGRLVKVEDEDEIQAALAAQAEYDAELERRSKKSADLVLNTTTSTNTDESKKSGSKDKTDAEKRTELEDAYNKATGETAAPDASDDDLNAAIAEASKNAGSKKKGLASLADEGSN